MFKLLVIGVIIIGRDPFALFGMQAPGIWEWGQGNKVSSTRTVGVFNALILSALQVEPCVRGSYLEVRTMQWVLAWLCFSYTGLHTLGSVYLHPWDFISSSRSTAGVIRYCFACICCPQVYVQAKGWGGGRGRVTATATSNITRLHIKRCCCLCFNRNQQLLNWIAVLRSTENKMI